MAARSTSRFRGLAERPEIACAPWRSLPQRQGQRRPDREGRGADSKKLTRTQRELVSKLAESMSIENKPTSPSLMEKMKDLFN